LVTVVGYTGFTISLLVGLSIAGINITGLAVVAGALSVGIGFGLQSIANNFVSGIILLFERPIKAGDFVTVGDVEGFVKKISIRATEIETLDNQDMLVPNSELISGRVTNWVLHNPYGRLRIKVGVAYGSDINTVKQILETVSQNNDNVITDNRASPPKALFMGFGDSALEFELRLRITDIRKRYDVTSDLNFKINEAFKKAGIVIPFPQRDLHIKDWSPESKKKSK
jgi:small-conductance mechanosensitive channel